MIALAFSPAVQPRRRKQLPVTFNLACKQLRVQGAVPDGTATMLSS
jgi:hypothetical protein